MSLNTKIAMHRITQKYQSFEIKRDCLGNELALSRRKPERSFTDSGFCSTSHSLCTPGKIMNFFKPQFPHLYLLTTTPGSCDNTVIPEVWAPDQQHQQPGNSKCKVSSPSPGPTKSTTPAVCNSDAP